MVNMKPEIRRDGAQVAVPWHPADIIAGVRKAGTSLQRLSLQHGFNSHSMNKAVRQCFPACHRIIADVIGVPPETIWPQFYFSDGRRRSLREQRREQARREKRVA